MERLTDKLLTKKIGLLCGLFLASGVILNFAPRPKQIERTEEEVASLLPVKVNSFNAQLAPGQYCTSKMDQSNYDILQPWGIVLREFMYGNEGYEVVVIASRKKESFHDPQVCLTAQGWTLSNQRVDTVKTKNRGDVPVTLFDMEKSGQKLTSMYFLKTTTGYKAEMAKVKWDMFMYKLSHVGTDQEGAFVRIIPNGNSNVEKMKKFAADWIDEATQTSKGFY